MGYVAGGVEYTTIAAVNTIFSFPGGTAVPAYTPIQRDFLNTAPEAGLLYRLNDAWQFRGRVATGYGTPNIGNLTVTPQGVSGNNSQLASQTNVGIDLGADWTPDPTVKLSVTGFYEFFRNELVTQSPGAGLQNFTFNVPKLGASRRGSRRGLASGSRLAAHRRLHLARPVLHRLHRAAQRRRADTPVRPRRKQNPRHIAATNSSRGSDMTSRSARGKAWAHSWNTSGRTASTWRTPICCARRVTGSSTSTSTTTPRSTHPYLKGAIYFFEVKNLLDKTYIASANNITDSINTATGLQNPGSVLARLARDRSMPARHGPLWPG